MPSRQSNLKDLSLQNIKILCQTKSYNLLKSNPKIWRKRQQAMQVLINTTNISLIIFTYIVIWRTDQLLHEQKKGLVEYSWK